jgi:hypothetical protein
VHFKITQGCDALKESRCFEIKMSVAAREARIYYLIWANCYRYAIAGQESKKLAS